LRQTRVAAPYSHAATDARRAHRAAVAGQGEEDGLKRVVRVGRVPQHPSADAEHHRAVPFDERGEGGLVAPLDEAGEQVGVRRGGRDRTADETD